MEALLSPLFTPVPFRQSLVSISVVHINMTFISTTSIIEDMTELASELISGRLTFLPGSGICDEGSNQMIVCSVRKVGGIVVECLHAMHGIPLKHEEGVVECWFAVSSRCKEIVYLPLGSSVTGPGILLTSRQKDIMIKYKVSAIELIPTPLHRQARRVRSV